MNELQGDPRSGWRLPMALGIIYVLWGSTYLAIRVMVRSIPPLLMAGARFIFAGAVLGLFLLIRRGPVGWDVSLRQTCRQGAEWCSD